MKSRLPFIVFVTILLALYAHGQTSKPAQASKVKPIYSSDLYFPPDDPDDWFDLATLFATPEIDILGVILDQQVYDRQPQREGTGTVPLRQIFEISGRNAPYASGCELR